MMKLILILGQKCQPLSTFIFPVSQQTEAPQGVESDRLLKQSFAFLLGGMTWLRRSDFAQIMPQQG